MRFKKLRSALAGAILLTVSPAFAQSTISINGLPTGSAPAGTENVPVSQLNTVTGIYATVKLSLLNIAIYAGNIFASTTHSISALQTFSVAPQYSTITGFGKSIANPGSGFLESLLQPQTIVGTNYVFSASDLFMETRRSNGGSAMSDTLPTSTATGLTNGTRITTNNIDSAASDTITAGSGTQINGASSVVVGPLRSVAWIYDTTTSPPTWRSTFNGMGGALLGVPNVFTNFNSFNLNAAAAPSAQSGAVWQGVQADSVIARSEIDSFGAASHYSGIRANGTNASPTTVVNGNELTSINGGGFDGSTRTVAAAAFRTYAAQTWAVGAHGAYSDVATTPIGSTTLASAMRWDSDQSTTAYGVFLTTGLTNAALKAKSITNVIAGETVIRAGFASLGDSPPVTYTFSASPCSLNSGAGDNGSQVAPASGTGCWLANFPSNIADITDFGAIPGVDSTVAIQSDINWAAAIVGGTVLVPGAGTPFLINASTPAVPSASTVYIKGNGPSVSVLEQTSSTGGCLSWLNTPSAPLLTIGGLEGIGCLAGSTRQSINSTGTALTVQGANDRWRLNNFSADGFSTGVEENYDWNDFWNNVWIFNANIGLDIGCNSSFLASGSNQFTNWHLEEQGSFGTSTLGVKVCNSGGEYFGYPFEVGGFGHALLVQPQTGSQQVSGLSFATFNGDTSTSDGVVFDGTNGVIGDFTGIIWANFNNGSGIKCLGGTNTDQINLTINDRENGLYGVDNQSCQRMSINNSSILANARGQLSLNSAGLGCSKNDALTVVGGTGGPITINVRSVNGSGAVTGYNVFSSIWYSVQPTNPVSVTGGTCTTEPTFNITFPTNSAAVHAGSGATYFQLSNDQIGNAASNSNPTGSCLLIDSGGGAGIQSHNNKCIVPHLDAWVNNSTAIYWDGYADRTYTNATFGNVASAGTSVYLGPSGSASGSSVGNGWTIESSICEIVGFRARWTSDPTPAATYTFSLYLNGSAIPSLTSNAVAENQFTAAWQGTYTLSSAGQLTLQLVGSASADSQPFTYNLFLRCQ